MKALTLWFQTRHFFLKLRFIPPKGTLFVLCYIYTLFSIASIFFTGQMKFIPRWTLLALSPRKGTENTNDVRNSRLLFECCYFKIASPRWKAIRIGCCFLVHAMLPKAFPFHQFNSIVCTRILTYYAALKLLLVGIPKWHHKIAGNDVTVINKFATRSPTVYNGSVLFRPSLDFFFTYSYFSHKCNVVFNVFYKVKRKHNHI